MKPARGKERRKLLMSVDLEQRRAIKDRRSCPDCGGAVLEKVAELPYGHYFIQFCNKCPWQAKGKRIKHDETVRLLTSKVFVVAKGRKASLTLPAMFVQASNSKDGSVATLKPIFKPGLKHGKVWQIEFDS